MLWIPIRLRIRLEQGHKNIIYKYLYFDMKGWTTTFWSYLRKTSNNLLRIIHYAILPIPTLMTNIFRVPAGTSQAEILFIVSRTLLVEMWHLSYTLCGCLNWLAYGLICNFFIILHLAWSSQNRNTELHGAKDFKPFSKEIGNYRRAISALGGLESWTSFQNSKVFN